MINQRTARGAALAALLFASVGALPSARAAQRLAIVVGNNTARPFVPRLWYSERDADRVTRTLVELGQFAADDVVTLKDQDVGAIRAAFAKAAERVKSRPTEPAFIFFYYSGHADGDGLEVGNDILPYTELRALMTSSPAQTKVAVLDACDSGSLTRVRRGNPVSIAVGQEEAAEGIVYISSTAIGEAAQESASLQGGFFTTHLEAAMRGAADEDHDGRVTLSEAFKYSSVRTTEDTLKTQSGPQHPTYTMTLAGRGDVVLTDLRVAEAMLVLPPAPEALYAVKGAAGFLQEIAGSVAAMQLALPSGRYEVERRTSGGLETKAVQLAPHATYEINEMESATLQWSRLRGGSLPLHLSVGGFVGPSVLGWGILSGGGAVAVSRPVGPVDLRAHLGVRTALIPTSEGPYALWSGELAGGPFWPVFHRDGFLLEVGPEIGVGRIQQVKTGFLPSGTMDYMLAATAVATLWAGPVRWGPFLSAEGHLNRMERTWRVQALLTGGLGLGF